MYLTGFGVLFALCSTTLNHSTHTHIYIYIYRFPSLRRSREFNRLPYPNNPPLVRPGSILKCTHFYFRSHATTQIKVTHSHHRYGILQQTQSFTIREQVKFMPEYCFGCPPCLKQGKSYYVTAGNDPMGTNFSGMLFRADEVSEVSMMQHHCISLSLSFSLSSSTHTPHLHTMQYEALESMLLSSETPMEDGIQTVHTHAW